MAEAAARHWPAIEAATHRERRRLPFAVLDAAEPTAGRAATVVGSVDRDHLDALADFAPLLALRPDGVTLAVPAAERDAALAQINRTLHERGLLRAWRDETFPLFGPDGQRVLARMERAATRFWGTLTLGAHCTGWVAGPDGRPAALWIAQRAFDKATDPGAHDNLVGGGVPLGQTPYEALLREGWEEAGLGPAVMRRATPGRVIALQRDIPEGLMVEHIHSYDLCLDPGETPHNQDGEVHAFERLPLAEALALAAGDTRNAPMTTDAALATLEFALRRRLLPPAEQAHLARRCAHLWRGDAAS